MNLGFWFGLSVAVLQSAACLSFLVQGSWKDALFWGGVSAANFVVVFK